MAPLLATVSSGTLPFRCTQAAVPRLRDGGAQSGSAVVDVWIGCGRRRGLGLMWKQPRGTQSGSAA
eukprot:8703268-Alexandrium_andersonii.AAC.1